MKKNDLIFLASVVAVVAAFALIPNMVDIYKTYNNQHGMWMSFLKFAILATLGESIALRIRTGKYNEKGFGLLPRAMVWGVLGLTIKMAFVVFANGVPVFLAYLGFEDALTAMKSGLGWNMFLTAFSISTAMNLIYAPVMMTFHKITDVHIEDNGGTLAGLFRPIQFGNIISKLDWNRQWNFVFKKTIPFFWIPAHTITFLLPESMQVLFAALLGIALGVLLSLRKG